MEKKEQVLTLQQKLWGVKLELPKLKKSTKGFKFKYTNLGDVEKALRPLLIKRKIGYEHSTSASSDGNILSTTIFDLESESIKVVELLIPDGVTLAGMNGYQSLGSALTYFKRYNLITGFGVLTDDDVDAQTPQKKVTPAKVTINHLDKISQLIKIGREKPTVEKYLSMYSKDMSEEQIKQAKELIFKIK